MRLQKETCDNRKQFVGSFSCYILYILLCFELWKDVSFLCVSIIITGCAYVWTRDLPLLPLESQQKTKYSKSETNYPKDTGLQSVKCCANKQSLSTWEVGVL